jgi:hypothetical protein
MGPGSTANPLHPFLQIGVISRKIRGPEGMAAVDLLLKSSLCFAKIMVLALWPGGHPTMAVFTQNIFPEEDGIHEDCDGS